MTDLFSIIMPATETPMEHCCDALFRCRIPVERSGYLMLQKNINHLSSDFLLQENNWAYSISL